jgi:hypothetical protein
MNMNELWYPSAIKRPGPQQKRGYGGVTMRPCRGTILHDAQGWLTGAFERLDNLDLDAYNHYRAGSWHFTVERDGTIYQHYPLYTDGQMTVCWHAGNLDANERYLGIEHIGITEPLTLAQVAADVALLTWADGICGWERPWKMGKGLVLAEHWMYSSTTCPNGRIPWIKLIEELAMTDKVIEALKFDLLWTKTRVELADLALQGTPGALQLLANKLKFWGVKATFRG